MVRRQVDNVNMIRQKHQMATRSRAKGTARPLRTYHHGNLRAALVEAAAGLLATSGPLGVTLRGAARRAGVSQTAPYRHFADKDALLAAVAEGGFRALAEATSGADQAERSGPIRKLEAIAVAYVRFAVDSPSRYRLMFGPVVRGRSHGELRAAAQAAWSVLNGAVVSCQRSGRMRTGEPAALSFVLWSLLHGLAALILDEQLPPALRSKASVENLTAHATRVLLEGLERKRVG